MLNERDFPHLVDIVVPEGGLGRRLDAMHEWLRERGLEARRGGGGIGVSRWCFADPRAADEFAEVHGGTRRTTEAGTRRQQR